MSKEHEIRVWCVQGALPPEEAFLKVFRDENGRYISAEGEFWDFKREWPASYSDEYFGGLARLVCAFANTQGGVIIFGVDDQTRKGGQNNNDVDLDRFLQALEQLIGSKIKADIRTYSATDESEVCALLISPRRQSSRPLRFLRAIGKYRAGEFGSGGGTKCARPRQKTIRSYSAEWTLWMKRRNGMGLYQQARRHLNDLSGVSKSSMSYLNGCKILMNASLRAWKRWFRKTTIAYEFARLLKEYGQEISIIAANK